ncbi:hypothetical protein SCLCIDRAFT_113180 [Scleroderma citrinum Foug A]|uniref:Uncharacterized protein n=1 Tax=Scleroderma citrinum Foug A TaxID=1036808 RepID=A0A0C2ZV22_9AGAM|nr:hypothetical protein SCLCIDRAFT_113180 [Scleroderma citrinum Foug A]
METWPVAECCEPELQKLLSTHDICPLPAYNLKEEMIPPSQYHEKLKGAIVEVHFALGHYFIKKTKRHIFNAILRKLIVLHRPTELPSSPYKHLCISAHTPKK